ncbi:MAG: nicotinate-nucleotide adenylyltransferase, partial [Burkholderiaceae bacterium]
GGRRRIGLLGGTFDPIHVAHLALADWARAELALDEVRLIPTGRSWQKEAAGASAADRLRMAELAAAGRPWLAVDGRETRRAGSTYTIDTLAELRAELGPEPALVWLLGSDQLHNLPTWQRYESLTSYAHLAVTQRERVALSDFPPAVEALLARHGAQTLPDAPCGAIVFFRMPALPVSGTVLRRRLAVGERPRELVPGPVLDYIDQAGLYRRGAGAEQR